MSAHEILAPVLAAVGGVSAAGVTGWFLVRREREARQPADHASAVDGFDKLTARLDGEVSRLSRELTLVRREREARVPADHASAVDGFDRLTARLDGEVARLSRELASVRQQLAAASEEVAECERARHELEARVAALELQLVRNGVLERRHHDHGPEGPERRQP